MVATSFSAAEENFHLGARDGIDARLYWPGVGEVPVAELVLRRLPRSPARGFSAGEWKPLTPSGC